MSIPSAYVTRNIPRATGTSPKTSLIGGLGTRNREGPKESDQPRRGRAPVGRLRESDARQNNDQRTRKARGKGAEHEKGDERSGSDEDGYPTRLPEPLAFSLELGADQSPTRKRPPSAC